MQLSFSFSTNIDIYDVRNFIVHDGNRNIFDFVTSSFFLNNNIYFLTGPKNSGKTYICKIWNRLKQATFIDSRAFKYNKDEYINYIEGLIEQDGKYILDDIEQAEIPEDFLLYLINSIVEKKAILLVTSTKYVNDFSFNIPDLQSRFNNIFNFILDGPNEDSKQKIILKLLTDRQMNIDSNVLSFLSKKISGNYSEIFKFVNDLENMVNANKTKKITINIVNKLLNNNIS